MVNNPQDYLRSFVDVVWHLLTTTGLEVKNDYVRYSTCSASAPPHGVAGQTNRERERERERETDKERQRETQRDTDTETQTHTQAHIDTDTHRHTHSFFLSLVH